MPYHPNTQERTTKPPSQIYSTGETLKLTQIENVWADVMQIKQVHSAKIADKA